MAKRKSNIDVEIPQKELNTTAPSEDVIVVLTEKELEAQEKAAAAKALRMYFNAGTQAAIVAYQSTDIKKDKDRYYVKEILPAFNKLVENLINIHKFTSLHDTYDDLKTDCVNFLFETLNKFDASRGTLAFSYFNVVAKNWLIIKTKQKSARNKRTVSLDDPESLTVHEQKNLERHNTVQSQDSLTSTEETSTNVKYLLKGIRGKAKTENELSCINSIITIFENIEDVDLLNKSAVLLYMRELSGLSPKQLTTAIQVIKKHYKKMKIEDKYTSTYT